MIVIGEKKAVICKGDFHPAALYKGDKKITGYTVESFEAENGVVLENCYNDKVYDSFIHNNNLFDAKRWFPDWVNDEGGISFTLGDSSVPIGSLYTLGDILVSLPYKENTRYTFSGNYEITKNANNQVYFTVGYTDGTKKAVYAAFGGVFEGDKSDSFKFTTAAGKTLKWVKLSWSVTYDKYCNVKLTQLQICEGAVTTEYESPLTDATITVRGKNYFDLDKVPFSNNATQPYKNGLKATKLAASNRGDRIPISLPADKTIYITLDIVDSQIDGTAKRVTLDFLDSGYSRVFAWNITSTIAHKSYSYTPTKEIKYAQFYFQSNNSSNAVGDYVTMDNIMLRTEGDDSFEPYLEPQTIPFENGEPTTDIPTFKGTTVIEVESDITATISGKYKKVEEI